ncbi:MAG: alpha/beta hydrolase, partial [Candidatus Competibacteraceae bacterium]|nr:alpha/beta hydrolase [Candidatus Competibacteraceae bacterium]
LADCNALIARAGVEQVDWVGTSMGGLIGMMLAAQPGSPLGRLVINDVGPFIPKEALERIASYVGQSPAFAELDELERYMRVINAPFGELSDEQWRHLAVHNARQTDSGQWIYAYDPGIREIFSQSAIDDINLWPVWDGVCNPTLLLRGADSDVLRREDAQAMTRRGPKPELVEFTGVGHAPVLMNDEQIAVVRNWLLAA